VQKLIGLREHLRDARACLPIDEEALNDSK
jgi:hypothetical protein